MLIVQTQMMWFAMVGHQVTEKFIGVRQARQTVRALAVRGG